MRTLDDWLEHIQAVHHRSIDLALDRVRRVRHVLRLRSLPAVITVAGTNGKGSCVAMLDAIYRSAGYRVGTYTSPHLVRYNERVRVNRVPATDAELCAAFERIEACRGGIPLTYFEFGTLAALEVLTHHEVEVAVLEVGMGGRLDAVNMFDSDVAFIVSIGLDHTRWLGQRRDLIAAEKAGIFRYGRPAVCAEPDPPATIAAHATLQYADLYQIGQQFGVVETASGWNWWGWEGSADELTALDELPRPSIPGSCQLNNAAGTIAAVRNLHAKRPVSADQIRTGLAEASAPGRLQFVSGAPDVVLDVAHNADSVASLNAYLIAHPRHGRTFAVIGVLDDKPIGEMAKIVGDRIDAWYVGSLEVDRGTSATEIKDRIGAAVPTARVTTCNSVEAAFTCARSASTENDRVLVFGSFYTVGVIMQYLNLPTYATAECRV